MANSSQAAKRARQDVQRRQRNQVHRTRLRTFQKRVVASVAKKDVAAAKQALAAFVAVADQVAGKGCVHRNKAARIKSRLNGAVAALARSSAS